MLLVHHGKAQIVKHHVLLKHRMGANKHVDITRGQCGEFGLSLRALVAACQQRQHDACGFGQGLEAFHMLARENFGRGHHDALPARFNCCEQRHQRDQRFAGAHIPLQKPVHPRGRPHVIRNFTDRTRLRAGGPVGQCVEHFGLQSSRRNAGNARLCTDAGAGH